MLERVGVEKEKDEVPQAAVEVDAPAQPDNAEPPRSCSVKIVHIKRATYSFPVGAASCEAIQTMIDLQGKHPAIVALASVCNFGASLSINSKYNHDGIEDAFNVIERRQIPADWPKLSKTREVIGATATIVMGGWAAFADSVLAYYFVNELSGKYAFAKSINSTVWQGLSGTTGGFVGLNIISGEAMATWKKIREILAGVKPEYSNRASRYLTPTIGYTIAIFGSFNDGVMTCTGLYEVFEITSLAPRIITGAACSSIAFTDYFMNGAFVIECLDIYFGSFTPEEGQTPAYKNPKIIAAFILSLAAGGLLAYTYHGITKGMMLELLETVGVDYASVTDPIIETLACGGATSFFVNSTGSVYPIFYKIADVLGNTLNSIYNKAYNCCFGANIPEDFFDLSDDNEAQEFADDFEVVVDASDNEFEDALDQQNDDDQAETSHDDELGDDAFFDANDMLYDEAYSYHSSEEERTARMLYNLFTPQKEPDVQPGSNPQNSPRK